MKKLILTILMLVFITSSAFSQDSVSIKYWDGTVTGSNQFKVKDIPFLRMDSLTIAPGSPKLTDAFFYTGLGKKVWVKWSDASATEFATSASIGIYSLGGLNASAQTFAIGTAGTAPAFSSVTSTHTLNIPMASTASVTAGLLSKTDYDIFNAKANSALSNLSAVAINAALIPNASGTIDLGSATYPYRNIHLPVSTASIGIIYSGNDRYIHNYGSSNFFAGVNAGNMTMTGINNTVVGVSAFVSNISGHNCSVFGKFALQSNTTGIMNTALGAGALLSNTTGSYNSGLNEGALYKNTTGSNNTSAGFEALYMLEGAYNDNTAFGYRAGKFQADGITALITPSNSLYIGSRAKGLNNSDVNSIVIGFDATGAGANSVVLGNSSITKTVLRGVFFTSAIVAATDEVDVAITGLSASSVVSASWGKNVTGVPLGTLYVVSTGLNTCKIRSNCDELYAHNIVIIVHVW